MSCTMLLESKRKIVVYVIFLSHTASQLQQIGRNPTSLVLHLGDKHTAQKEAAPSVSRLASAKSHGSRTPFQACRPRGWEWRTHECHQPHNPRDRFRAVGCLCSTDRIMRVHVMPKKSAPTHNRRGPCRHRASAAST